MGKRQQGVDGVLASEVVHRRDKACGAQQIQPIGWSGRREATIAPITE
jgi:hypothetical protein